MYLQKRFIHINIIIVIIIALSFIVLNNNITKKATDLKQIKTALELYFNTDKSLVFLGPSPKNSSLSDCVSPTDSHYIYEPAAGSTYTLKYCLGNEI